MRPEEPELQSSGSRATPSGHSPGALPLRREVVGDHRCREGRRGTTGELCLPVSSGDRGGRLPPAEVRGAPGGGVVVLEGNGGDEAGLALHVVGDLHEAVVGEPHKVRAVHPTVVGALLLPVVVLVLFVVHLPLEVVLHHTTTRLLL